MSTKTRETKILLTPTNYGIWMLSIQSKLQQIVVLSMLEDNVPVKTDANKAAILDLSEKTYHLIIVHLAPEVLAYVSSVYSSPTRFNGYALWHLLKCTTLVATLLLRPPLSLSSIIWPLRRSQSSSLTFNWRIKQSTCPAVSSMITSE
ncbi:hypothetical protein KEM48_014342 [Puccinia striiformis f. sp. tritici PST-130]|nr:hypothetical protein KEM48_014342 [Puccinia striiformis f. sp. tritici PST-130]